MFRLETGFGGGTDNVCSWTDFRVREKAGSRKTPGFSVGRICQDEGAREQELTWQGGPDWLERPARLPTGKRKAQRGTNGTLGTRPPTRQGRFKCPVPAGNTLLQVRA